MSDGHQRLILVLNASYEPLHVVDLRKAIHMLHRQVAVVEESSPTATFGPYPRPLVLRLVRYVSVQFRGSRASWNRDNVLRRDQYTCGYCGRRGNTVDHILPVSRGGQNTWENTVTACTGCNSRKGAKLPAEAGMTLRVTPYAPAAWEMWNVSIPEWLNLSTR